MKDPFELDEYFGKNHANILIPHQVFAFSLDQAYKMTDPQGST